jgi:hypothetical protein
MMLLCREFNSSQNQSLNIIKKCNFKIFIGFLSYKSHYIYILIVVFPREDEH